MCGRLITQAGMSPDCGDLRAGLERRGRPLGAMDLMIAAHARSRGATLVSNDVRHFERVEGLLVANWV